MYLGRVVEIAATADIFAAANHPYTQALLSEVPRIDLRKRSYHPVKGEIPSPLDPPPGCHFHPRCPHAMPRCRIERPALREIAPGRWSACHLNDGSRSEEHTSELRSLMRISYAVFCLKKKKTK